MAKAAGYSSGKTGGLAGGRAGYSARAGVARNYGFSRMPDVMPSRIGHVNLWKEDKKMRKRMEYDIEPRKFRPYEKVGELEKSAYLFREKVSYAGKQKGLYSGSADKGYGRLLRGEAYQTPNIINISGYNRRMLDNAYRKISGREGYQLNFQYSQAA
jgi:hypothetical protein